MGGFVEDIGNLLGGAATLPFDAAGTIVQGFNPLLKGLVSPPNGASFQATGAPIVNPVSEGQIKGGFDQNNELIKALLSQNGIQNQSNVFDQVQGVANGTGPNPALDQLNNSTGQNVANQAALTAGQRGGSANVGLLSRNAGQQGGAIQQQSAGQAALLSAIQRLNALGQLGGIAGQQVGQLESAVQTNTGQLLGGANIQNQANIGNQSNLNETNQRQAGINSQNQANLIGGVFKGASAAAAPKAHGGEIENPKTVPKGDRFSGNLLPSHLKPVADIYGHNSYEGGGEIPGKALVKGDSLKNDVVPIMASPGEFMITKSVMESKDPVGGAAKMVADHLKKSGHKGDFKEALKKAIQGRKSK